jgi:hypothetical protein
LKRTQTVIDETRISSAACGCLGQTHENILDHHLVGPVHIRLTSQALQSGSTFAGAAGHELTHGVDYVTNTHAAEDAKASTCNCPPGGNQLEVHAYSNQAIINNQVDQYLENHADPPGPDAKQQTPP